MTLIYIFEKFCLVGNDGSASKKWCSMVPGVTLFCVDCAVKHTIWLTDQGWGSPSLKLCYFSLWLVLFQWITLPDENTLTVELGESRPRVTAF
jgi:hypothetical protein